MSTSILIISLTGSKYDFYVYEFPLNDYSSEDCGEKSSYLPPIPTLTTDKYIIWRGEMTKWKLTFKSILLKLLIIA